MPLFRWAWPKPRGQHFDVLSGPMLLSDVALPQKSPSAAWLAALGAAARDIAAQDLPTRLLHLLFALIRFVAEPSVLRRQLRDRETVSPEATLG
jgi:hypothetical protein